MKIGWIDFSKSDRNKVLDVINLLDEPGTVDELGLGTIRDAFADYFFPGTSTVQTRAKYFLIVPYLLKEAGEGDFGDDPEKILRAIDDEERKCRDILIQTSSDGVIGIQNPNSWVLRPPSSIYWNGIKKLGIFTDSDLLLKQYIIQTIIQRNRKQTKRYGNRRDDAEENEKDDVDAGDLTLFHFWNLGNTYSKNWRDDLSIKLLSNEAEFLKNQIITYQYDTLFAFILKNDISLNKYSSFEELFNDIEDLVDNEELKNTMKLANDFNKLLRVITTRYNLIVSCHKSELANERWLKMQNNIANMDYVDINMIFRKLNIKSNNLRKFLLSIIEELLNNNIDKVDELIIKREVMIKGSGRAKTKNSSSSFYQEWIGAYEFDYRFTPAKRIIEDIMHCEGGKNV